GELEQRARFGPPVPGSPGRIARLREQGPAAFEVARLDQSGPERVHERNAPSVLRCENAGGALEQVDGSGDVTTVEGRQSSPPQLVARPLRQHLESLFGDPARSTARRRMHAVVARV